MHFSICQELAQVFHFGIFPGSTHGRNARGETIMSKCMCILGLKWGKCARKIKQCARNVKTSKKNMVHSRSNTIILMQIIMFCSRDKCKNHAQVLSQP